MDPADRVLQELQREVAQVEPLRHQVAVFQGDLSAYHLEVEALRAEVRALRDQIAPLQEATFVLLPACSPALCVLLPPLNP